MLCKYSKKLCNNVAAKLHKSLERCQGEIVRSVTKGVLLHLEGAVIQSIRQENAAQASPESPSFGSDRAHVKETGPSQWSALNFDAFCCFLHVVRLLFSHSPYIAFKIFVGSSFSPVSYFGLL